MSNGWRDDPITEKQQQFIECAMEFSPYPVPRFNGTTNGEASDWIDRYGRIATENPWSIEHGYN